MLCAVGDLIEDLVVQLHDDVRRDADTAASITRRRGGSAANVAYFAAKLTGRSRFVGNVGADALGDSLVARLQRDGVQVCGERSGRTGSIVVMTGRDGERTMLTDRGDALALSAFNDEWLNEVSVLHVPLYSFAGEPIATASRAAMQAATARGIHTSIDLSSVTVLAQLGSRAVHELLESLRPTLVFCTAAEAATIELSPSDTHGAGVVVVKDGARPVTTFGPQHDSATHDVVAAQRVVDGTGAGDAFAAGMLTELSTTSHFSQADLARGVAAGNRLAREVVGRAGATLDESLMA
ncbi:MAG: sugar kinase, partial [Acidimicrobiia bacterium]|nr:sugar kinase [Acidimicrobiia bacterium]